MTDWLAICRAAVEDVRRVLDEMPEGDQRGAALGTGSGGDETLAIDEAAERAVVARLEELHAEGVDFVLVSEELGERGFGGEGTCVVLDPIDGSVNAKRGIPHFCLSLAIANGRTLGDVHFGYVYDFGSGEEWTARLGEGAWVDGKPLGETRPRENVEILALEATTSRSIADRVVALAGFAPRLRVMGSLALALCHLAAGRVDAVGSLKEARAVDIAAAQLLVREAGYLVGLAEGSPLALAPLDTAGRSPVVAAGGQDAADRLAGILAEPSSRPM